MLKLIPRHRLHVPHGLAMAGALLLLASTVTGVGSALHTQPEATAVSYVAERDANATRQSTEAVQQAPVKKSGRFKVKLFQFRR